MGSVSCDSSLYLTESCFIFSTIFQTWRRINCLILCHTDKVQGPWCIFLAFQKVIDLLPLCRRASIIINHIQLFLRRCWIEEKCCGYIPNFRVNHSLLKIKYLKSIPIFTNNSQKPKRLKSTDIPCWSFIYLREYFPPSPPPTLILLLSYEDCVFFL